MPVDTAPSQSCPEITAVLLAPSGFGLIRETIEHLHAQTVCERIELLVLAAGASQMELPTDMAKDFAAARIVPLPPGLSVGEANALAVREAGAKLVVFCEDHSFPQPLWAEALIAAHSGPEGENRAAVGPCVDNANPATVTSWANFLVEYGAWTAHERGQVVSHLPGHNSCYKRDVLLSYGEELGAMLEAESVLHWDLQQKGFSLYLEPCARTRHLNFSAQLPSAMLRFHNGQSFAAARATSWPAWRRLVYAIAAPLIPFVRYRRIVAIWRRCRRSQSTLPVSSRALLPVLLLALILDATGEMYGYAFGSGASRKYLWNIEFDRKRFALH